jgi:general secretion pathway protein D
MRRNLLQYGGAVPTHARILDVMSVPLVSACLLAVIAAALIGCGTGPERDYGRRFVETRPAGPLTGASRAAPTALSPSPDEGEPVQRVVRRGTGTFLTPPVRPAQSSITTEPGGGIMLNVVDGELREVVRMVLESALGANYVIDPSVGGRITIQTTRPMPAADLVPVLDAVLRMNGAALVQTGDLFKVVPIDQALTAGPMPDVRPVPGAGTPGFGVQVVPLRFVSATELSGLLEPFTPPGGTIQVDAMRNLLLLAGSSDQLASLRDLVSIFDVDWMRGMSFGLLPLENAAASDLAQELDQIFGVTEEAGPLAGLVRFVPIDRLNAIMVVSSQPAYLDEAETWVRNLDRTGEGEEAQIYVYPVQNARAANLAEVLSETFGARTVTVGEPSLLAPGREAEQLRSTEGFELGATAGEQETSPEQAAGAERPRPTGPLPPRARATPLSPTFGPEEEGQPETRIIADDSTNSLVISALPRDYRKIREAIERLDILPLQVLIEATIAEVTLNNALRYGVEWFFETGDFEFTFSRSARGIVEPSFPGPGGFAALFSGGDARVVLTALEQVTDVNVISSPQLLVLDNQTARLQVGDQVPITVQQATPITGGELTVVNSIELRDTGVILTVTPRVNASGLVILEIQQEVSNVVRSETQTTSEETTPTINQRLVSSTVAVQTGETVALGGLITDNRNRTRSGVPILSSIPVIGVLFSTRSNTYDRTELLVLLTPSVIDSPERARAVTEELRRRLSSIAPGAVR